MTDKPSTSLWRCPCVLCTMACAIAFSAAVFLGCRLDFAWENERIWDGQFWRFLTSSLIHADIIHLAFNLYWLVELGRPIELRYGSLRTGLLFVLLAMASGAAEFLVSGIGGIGLSGVGYGLFGLLWAMRGSERGPDYALPNRVIKLFVGWFFFCLAATMAGVWSVGNMAHASGFVFGWALGRSLVSEKPRPWVSAVTISATVMVAATLYMPWSYVWWWHQGSEALVRGDSDRSRACWNRAVEMASDDGEVVPLLQELGNHAFYRDNLDEAIRFYRRAMNASDSPGIHRAYLVYAYLSKDDLKTARELAGKLSQADLDAFLRDIPEFVAFVSDPNTSPGLASRPARQTGDSSPGL